MPDADLTPAGESAVRLARVEAVLDGWWLPDECRHRCRHAGCALYRDLRAALSDPGRSEGGA